MTVWSKSKRVAKGRTMRRQSKAVSPEQKAVYHHETGAGKSHVRRRFFDLGDEDERVIAEAIEAKIDVLVQRA